MLDVLNIHVLITCIVMCIIGLVGLVGNVLMIRAWIKYRKLRNDFYTVFTALGIADILFLFISVPAQIIDQVDARVITTSWCKASNYLFNVSGFIAAYLIVVLSVLRGILLTNRNAVSRPQAKHLIIVCIVFYFIASVSSIPIVNMYFEVEGYCQFVYETDPERETWLMNAFASLVPLFLVLIIYLLTYLLGKRFFADSYSPREREKSRLVTSIIIAFVLCQIPYRVVAIYDTYNVSEDADEFQRIFTIKGYLMCLLMMDKAVRPVLYSKLASDLSQAFDEVINCKSCSKSYSVPPILEPRRGQRFIPSAVSSDNDVNNVRCSCLAANTNSPSAAHLVDRTISTSSSASATSQTPLTRPGDEVDIEMV